MAGKNLPVRLASSAATAKIRVTHEIAEGIKALQVAFPLPSQSAEERQISMRLYAQAIDGFPDAVSEFALRWLCFNNPRNTPSFVQPPTPQDVRECCEYVWNSWQCRVVNHYMQDEKWGGREQIEGGRKPLPWGPEPRTFGCYIPDDLVANIMQRFTGKITPDTAAKASKILERLDPEFFEPGRREALRAQPCSEGGLTRTDAHAGENTDRSLPTVGRPPPLELEGGSRNKKRKRKKTFDAGEWAVGRAAVEAFNQAARKLDFYRCENLTDERLERLLGRIEAIGGLDKFRLALSAIERDKWLMGNARRAGQERFKLSFDCLLSTRSEMGDVLARLIELAPDEPGSKVVPPPT